MGAPAARRWIAACVVAGLAGCRSPEDGRPRAGGPGADGGNYPARGIHVPSKIDGTKAWPTEPSGR